MLLVMCAPLFLRERDGERLFPWQPVDPNNLVPQLSLKATASFASIRKSMNTAFSLKSTRLAALLAIGVLAGTTLLSSVSKILILGKLEWSMEDYSAWITGLGYFFALGGSLLGGVLADLFSARRVAGAATVALGMVWIGFALLEPQWGNRSMIIGYAFAEQFCIGVMTVSLYAIFMGVSWPAIAATQFTAYMALLNLSLTSGTKLATWMGIPQIFGKSIWWPAWCRLGFCCSFAGLMSAKHAAFWANRHRTLPRCLPPPNSLSCSHPTYAISCLPVAHAGAARCGGGSAECVVYCH